MCEICCVQSTVIKSRCAVSSVKCAVNSLRSAVQYAPFIPLQADANPSGRGWSLTMQRISNKQCNWRALQLDHPPSRSSAVLGTMDFPSFVFT